MKLPGYRKRGNTFWREEGGFYRLIHLQKGAYGDYYFVNIALHPQGFPLLQTGPLYQPEHPKEHECLLRQRLDQIIKREKPASGGPGDPMETLETRLPEVLPDIETWGDWGTLWDVDLEELTPLFTTVPILWEKEFHLLKACCAPDPVQAGEHYRLYAAQCPELDFSAVDRWLEECLSGREAE